MNKKNYVDYISLKHSEILYKRRLKNGYNRKLRIAKRTTHEIAVKQRRKNKPEFPNPKWPARIRKKYCNKYQIGSLYV